MLFQLILQDTQWYQFLLNATITTIGRALDILSTRYITKELKLETNRLARKIGWKGMLLMQIPIIILGLLDFYLSLFIFWWSIFLFANNIEGSWYIKQAGEEAYQRELKDRLSKSKTWKIVFSELTSLLKFSLAGVLILVFLFVFNDLIAVLLISLVLIIQGIFGAISSIIYLLDLKKDNSNKG